MDETVEVVVDETEVTLKDKLAVTILCGIATLVIGGLVEKGYFSLKSRIANRNVVIADQQ